MAVVSGVAQATRAGQFSGALEERAQALTGETSRFLADRTENRKLDAPDSDGRIKWFLEKRNPSKYGFMDAEEDAQKDHSPPGMLPSPKQSDVSDTAD